VATELAASEVGYDTHTRLCRCAVDTLAAGRESQGGGRPQGGRPAQRLPGAADIKLNRVLCRDGAGGTHAHCTSAELQVLANSLGGLLLALAAWHGEPSASRAAFCLAGFLVGVAPFGSLQLWSACFDMCSVQVPVLLRLFDCRDTTPAAPLTPGPARWASSAAARRGSSPRCR
jgi:hypothetical protein